MSYLRSIQGETDLPDVFKKYPGRSALLLRVLDDILRGDSPFSVAERELIFAYVSSQNACSYCYDSHKPVAGAFGIDEAIFEELLHNIDAATINEKLKPVLKYVKKLTLTPAKMVQADAEAIYEAGWDEQAFVDVVSICVIANCFNRFVDGIGVDVSSEHARQTGATLLPTIGYGGLADELEKMG
jgi:uncharacterized peroxidase-related enzyme